MRRAWPATLAALAALLLGWELLARSELLPRILLPAASTVLGVLWYDAASLGAALRTTVTEIAIAAAIVWVAGIVIGFLSASFRLAASTLPPILMVVFTVPNVVMYPLIVAWVGFGPESKVFYGVLSGITPVAIGAWQGARLVNPAWFSLARAYGAGPVASFITVVVPAASATILSGLRIGTSLVVTGVLTAEMIAADRGLGFFISTQRALFNTGHVYAGIVVALTLVAVIQVMLTVIERQFDGWRRHGPATNPGGPNAIVANRH